MAQNLMKNSKNIAIIGAGPAGCMCAYFLQSKFNVTVFDIKSPLKTILYTGNGRCNLAYNEFDVKELAKNYPRGEKFLYSIFSRFSTTDTLLFFENLGIKTYIQDDMRIFPKSNDAKEIREKFLKHLKKVTFKEEKVLKITKENETFIIVTDKNSYKFDNVVISTGGKGNGYSLAKSLGHKIIDIKPSLVGLVTTNNTKKLAGISLKNISATASLKNKSIKLNDDILFTHKGLSGPLIFKISSIFAKENFNIQNPIKISLKFIDEMNFDKKFQETLNKNSKKDIKNILSDYIPQKLAEFLLKAINIPIDLKAHLINSEKRKKIVEILTDYKINVSGRNSEGEIVSAGGICLDEINPKTMESKLVKNLYFCGEILDIDGFCGGFNLQNCWSTGFIVGNSIT